MNYIGASIKSETEGNGEQQFTSTYTVNGTITLDKQFKYDIEWELYEYTNETGFDASGIITCPDVKTTTESGEVRYSQECTKGLSGASMIKSGKITGETDPQDEQKVETIASDPITINTGETKYYYLVVKYVSKEESQNVDMNKNIKLDITNINVTQTVAKTE